ncbi:MAG: hypothetical protein J6W29_08985 [Neisseriaceae bacterium]|nr:hypothetical protein [Neisseriaceae bacterium]
MKCIDDETGDYTQWFHKNIKFNGEYDFLRFKNSVEHNSNLKLIETIVYTEEKDYFNKVVKVFLCIKCKELFELHSSARGERLYETGYWKQFSGSLKRKSTIKNKVKIRLILTKLKQFFKEIK